MPELPHVDPDDPIAEHRTTWLRLIGDDAPVAGLLQRHREKHRRYHTLEHVLSVLRHVHELADSEPVGDIGAVVAAAWFHDAIYEPQSPANERASARLARRELTKLGWSTDRADGVGTMIEGTAAHLDPPDVDSAVLFDADLSILGAAPPAYETYVTQVRAEYSHVDDDTWRTGRADVLQSFLERTAIYATRTGAARWETAARDNLAAELDQF